MSQFDKNKNFDFSFIYNVKKERKNIKQFWNVSPLLFLCYFILLHSIIEHKVSSLQFQNNTIKENFNVKEIISEDNRD